MDQYICTRGEDDTFQLTDVRDVTSVVSCAVAVTTNAHYSTSSLILTDLSVVDLFQTMKYWRARFFLLPINSTATKRIMEGSDR